MPESFTTDPILSARFDEALVFAVEHHRLQLRKGTPIPYVAHVLAVAALVLEMGGSEDEAIAGLLHDVIEDGGGVAAENEIREHFGPDVVRIVRANSDTDVDPKPPWRQRKEAYVASIASKAPDELRVSIADKLHNARSILSDFRLVGNRLWPRFNAGDGDSVRWYYRALTDAFERRTDALGDGGRSALAELRRTIEDLDALASPSGPR